MTTLAQPLVGRETELEVLERMLEEACGGSPRFVVLTGEPGIGKTSLLAELARNAQERDCLVLEGRAAEFELELPFGLVVDAFDAYLESLDPRTYDRLAADGMDELAAVFPSLRSLGDRSSAPSGPAERFRAHHAVRELLERLGARQPVLLALDDVHWSDGASLELIGHLVRRRPEAAVMVAVAYRTGQARPLLAAAVEGAVRDGELARLELGPLGAEDAGRLVPEEAAAERDRLLRDSGGNPFYLLQLARGGVDGDGGAPVAHDADGQAVPAAVAAAIAGELAALPEQVRDFAQAAAVSGDPFELDLAVAAAELPEPEVLPALDELIARDVVRPTDIPRRFRFRHPLVRGAIYESSPVGFRLVAHERIAASLAARGAPASSRAPHVEESARHGDAEAVGVLRDAGLEAAARAPTSAARWFAAALRILPESVEPGERALLLASQARAQSATGQLEDARTALLEAIDLCAGASASTRVQLVSACAGVEQLLGRHGDAHRRLEAALEELGEPGSAEGASLMIDLAWDACLDARYEQMLEWARTALESARPLGDKPLTAAAAGIAAIATVSMGLREDAEALRAEAAGLVDGLPDEALSARPHGFQYLCGAEFMLDRYEDGIDHGLRGMAVARAGGSGELLPGIAQALGSLLIRSGRLTEASEFLDGAVDAARLTDNAVALGWAIGNRCYAAVTQGDVPTAVAMGEETLAATSALEHGFVRARAGAPVAGALLLAGQAGRAIDVLLGAVGGEEMPLVPAAWRAVGLEVLTRCYLEAGRAEDAVRAAERTEAVAMEFGAPFALALANRARAAVALAAGDAATAGEHALASAQHADEVGAASEAALARILAGRALALGGDPERATAELEQAATALDSCGAHRYRDEAERELRKLGRPVHRRTRRGRSDAAGLESLTGRELEIARLVVARRTNPEIAAELFLSIKTVETHMRNIFRKLGAASRVEVARIVEQAQGR